MRPRRALPTAPGAAALARRRTPERVAERVLIARARRRIGLLTAAVGTVVIAVVGAVAYALLVHGQDVQIGRELAYSLARRDAAVPPGCTWVFVRGQAARSGPGIPPPPGFPRTVVMDEVARTGRTVRTVLPLNGTTYHLRTERSGDQVVQAVFDARYQLDDRRLLLQVVLAVEAAGLLGSALTGLVLGRRAVAPLAEALARQRRFVADASHELRTPIAQVHTRAQLMLRQATGAGLPREHRAELDRLVRGTRLLGEVVDDLLLSAQLESGRLGAHAGPLDLGDLAQTAVQAEADRAAERGVTVRLARPPHPVQVVGARSALRRVIGELLANALTHTPAGGSVTVTVTGPEDRVATLVVRDTGSGFDPADADRIFGRFQQGGRQGDPHRGTTLGRRFGLGLALAREVVAGHGGRIEATAEPGHGARFVVRLPAAGISAVPRRRLPVLVTRGVPRWEGAVPGHRRPA